MQNTLNLIASRQDNQLFLRDRIPVSILGATGLVGQKLVQLLARHPWFKIEKLMASSQSAGKPYRSCLRSYEGLPDRLLQQEIEPAAPLGEGSLVFSALDSSSAGPIEALFAKAGNWVISNASHYRPHPEVPLIVPEVNGDHLRLFQEKKVLPIITNPNCVVAGLVIALKPLLSHFGLEACHLTTFQSVSGAGYPGVPSLDILDNIIPYIAGEEEKVEWEPKKILGHLNAGQFEDLSLPISASCHRVAVTEGHFASVSVKLRAKPSAEEVIEAWQEYPFFSKSRHLPSSPPAPLVYCSGVDQPQPKFHRHLDRGMAVAVGGLRPCSTFDFKFRLLSNNLMRGAAGAALLNAELLVEQGMLYW
ncbi:MAG: asd [Chlamydiales bacterium]|jgi:aspartate-semialdehyde dehydrogenase|nr:asd [Chlamydiales bacterium]